MKKVIHKFSSYASKWYFIALVVLIAQYALDGHSPGFGALEATIYSIVQNLMMSLCVGIFWLSIMSAVSEATRTRQVLNTSESTNLLNKLLIEATNKSRITSVEPDTTECSKNKEII